MANYRLIAQTDVDEGSADATLDTALSDAAAAFQAALTATGELVHYRAEFDVNGISPHGVAERADNAGVDAS